jgi:hypothetical protein
MTVLGPNRLKWRRLGATVVAAAVIAFAAAGLSAQVDTGSISGVVVDETGGALPGVTVTITSLTTGQTREVVTNETGRYQASALQPTTYSVKAELQGFGTVMRSPVTVNVGRAIDVNVTMTIASVQETVNVTTQAPLIDSTKAQISSVISQEQLEALPSKSRQYLDFTLLLPATVDSVSITQQGAGFSLGGARASEAALLVDGFYNMDEGFALPKQRYSQDSIQEFQVVSFGGDAEYGRAIGGIVNSVTKSGGNGLHGSGYGYFKDDSLNQNDPASVIRGVSKPPYSRQQAGVTLGGPIKHDKSFFFGSYERVKEDSVYDNAIRSSDASVIGLPAADVGNIPRQYRLNFALAKLDHNISATDRLQASFAISHWNENNLISSARATRSIQPILAADDYSYLFKWTRVPAGGRSLHEVKLSYFPRFYGVSGAQAGGPPLVPEGQINQGNISNASPPTVTIASVATFGSPTVQNEIDTYPVEGIYTSSLYRGSHTFKFGGDYMYAYYDYTLYSSLRGSYSFSSLANFQAGRYQQFSQGFGDPHNPRPHHYISAFIQDSWPVSNRLTMNYGLRYDVETHPKAPNGQRFGVDRNNFGPRFSMSYDLTGGGKTFLKFASGVYYDRIFQNITTFYTNLLGYQSLTQATWTPTTPGAPVYPQVFASAPASLPAGVVNTNILPDHFATPRSTQAMGTFEHALTGNLVVSASAIYTRRSSADYRIDANLVWDGTRWVRPNPAYRQVLQYQFDGWGNYIGGIFEVKRRGTRAGANGSLTLQRARDIGNNYSSAPNDQRIGIAGEYGPQADTPTVRGVVSGWYNILPSLQLSGVFQARSGMAVNPVAGGLDLVGAGNLGTRTPGFGRNSFRGPGFNQTDLRLTWNAPVPKGKLSVYLEGFNLFNQTNVMSVDNNYGPNPAQPLATWLTPTVYYAPRQVQLGARFTF